MKYIKQYKDGSDPFEITEEDARRQMEEVWDSETVSELLSVPGRDYNLKFSYISTVAD